MADTAVAITAGTGTNIDTRTEGTNSNHRQVVVLGDPATNAGVAPVDVTAGLKVDLGADNDVTITSGTITTLTNPLAAGTNAIGNVGLIPRASGGVSNSHLVAAGSTNATNVKASAGQLFAVTVYNAAAAARFVKFHNTAGTPTAGTGVVKTFGVQAGVAFRWASSIGVAFSTGIAFTTVTGIADADGNAVTASDLVIDVEYA